MMFVSHPIASGIWETPDRHRLSPLVGIRFAMAAVMSLGTQAVHAQDWTSIGGDERRIVFYAPNLNDKIRGSYFRITENHAAREEISIWRDKASGNDISGIYLNQLFAGRHFRSELGMRKITKQWDFFNGRTLRVDSKHTTGNKVGLVFYRIVNADNYNCVIFREYWGDAVTDGGTSGSTERLLGYYCADENEKLSVKEAKAVVRLLGVKDIGVPARPPVE
jgi:hypothetical protein